MRLLPPVGVGGVRAGLPPADGPAQDNPSWPGPSPDPAGAGARRQGALQRRNPARTGAAGAARPPFPSPPARPPTGAAGAARAAARPLSTRPPANSATPSNGPSASSASTVPWQPDTANATTSGAAPSMSPRSGSGSATPSHDLRDTL